MTGLSFISFNIQASFVEPFEDSEMNIRQKLTQPLTGPARGTSRPVFIDFTPTHEWKGDEDGSAVLVIALPGKLHVLSRTRCVVILLYSKLTSCIVTRVYERTDQSHS